MFNVISSLALTCAFIASILLNSSSSHAALSHETYSGEVAGLAQGCYSIKSSDDSFLSINLKGQYSFGTSNLMHAGQFYFKPVSFKEFLLGDRYQNTVSNGLMSESSVSENSVWQVEKLDKHLYSLSSGDQTIKAHLIEQHFCKPFAEISLNVEGDSAKLKTNATQPIRGVVDAHTHITSYEFVGGKFVHGAPFHRFGIEHAMGDCEHIHGPNGKLDLIGNLFSHDDPSAQHDTQGWPKFRDWPNYNDESHTDYYYRWIERAYLGGVRIMVSHLVESEQLCKTQIETNPASWVNGNSCDTMESFRLQAKRHYELQNYIDAQAGGPGKGFLRIVTSPTQAREVIADGKLAVIMGGEASDVLNCGLNDQCDQDTVDRNLDELYNLGVRSLYPVHKFDNRFAGSRVEDGILNAAQYRSGGYLFKTGECDEQTQGNPMSPGFPMTSDIPILGSLINLITSAPDYDTSIEHCNDLGLSELGTYLVNQMIDRGMLIELDHTSAKSASDIMDILEARSYSGVVSSHSWMSKSKDGGVHKNTERLLNAGGFVAPFNHNAYRMKNDIGQYIDTIQKSGFLVGVGIGTDMTGLANQAPPRSDVDQNPLEYPFTSELGLVFDVQVSGLKEFNYNEVGMAHYGMVADHIQEIRERSGNVAYEALMNSAEAYLQMWQRAYDKRSIE